MLTDLIWELQMCLLVKKGIRSPLNGSPFNGSPFQIIDSPPREVFPLSSYHDSAQLEQLDLQRHDTNLSPISAFNTKTNEEEQEQHAVQRLRNFFSVQASFLTT